MLSIVVCWLYYEFKFKILKKGENCKKNTSPAVCLYESSNFIRYTEHNHSNIEWRSSIKFNFPNSKLASSNPGIMSNVGNCYLPCICRGNCSDFFN